MWMKNSDMGKHQVREKIQNSTWIVVICLHQHSSTLVNVLRNVATLLTQGR